VISERCFNSNTQKKIDILHQKDFSNVTFVNTSFENVIIPEDAFIYFDPPYSNTEAGYNAIWNNKNEDELMRYLNYCIKTNQPFGISGCVNQKENKIYDFLIQQESLKVYYFEDLYQKISNKDKVNKEYYFTNVKEILC
jgi:site-specific DNA-adenine methylase